MRTLCIALQSLQVLNIFVSRAEIANNFRFKMLAISHVVQTYIKFENFVRLLSKFFKIL